MVSLAIIGLQIWLMCAEMGEEFTSGDTMMKDLQLSET